MKASRGFTLVEVVVALAISGMVLIGLAYLSRDAARAHDRLVSAGSREAEADAFFRAVEQLTEGIEVETQDEAARLAQRDLEPSLTGSAESLRVLSIGPRILALSKPVIFEIVAISKDRIQTTTLRWRGETSPLGDVIAANNWRLRFRYGARAAHGVAWQEQWRGPVLNLVFIEVNLIESGTGRVRSKTINLRPLFPSVCALRPLLTGCPQWR